MEKTSVNEKGKTILEIKGLSKSIGKKQILKDISLEVKGGEVFGFLGPNGSRYKLKISTT